ncbi:MAG: hypothetical protein ACE5GM_05985 [bacterium]
MAIIEKEYELLLKKLNALDKALSARTKELEIIIKESLEASFSLVKMVQSDTETHSQRLVEFKNRLKLLEESLEKKWQTQIELASSRSEQSVLDLTRKMETYDSSIKGLQKEFTDFSQLARNQQNEFLKRLEKSFDRHETSLDTVKNELHEQHDHIASIPKLTKELEEKVDYRLRESEGLARTGFNDINKTLTTVQDETYQQKKSMDIALNKLEQLQNTVGLELNKIEENVKLSFENHNAYISVLRNDIQHLQDPFKRLEQRVEKVSGAVRTRNFWSLISLAGIAVVVVVVNFMFNQQAKNRSLKVQQSYQQLYSVTQGTSEALIKTVSKSDDIIISQTKNSQEKNLKGTEEFNRKLFNDFIQGNRKQLRAIHDSNERQLNLIESLFKNMKKSLVSTVKQSNKKQLKSIQDNERQLYLIRTIINEKHEQPDGKTGESKQPDVPDSDGQNQQ